MARTATTNIVQNETSLTPDSAPEGVAVDDIPQEITAVVEEPQERPVWLAAWLKTVGGVEPEVLGTFEYIAKREGWSADTPSGWETKFSRWLNNS